jgi:hypothetical protein
MILRRRLTIAVVALAAHHLAAGLSIADETRRPASRVSASGFIKYWPGELPVVISAPHGGTKKPVDMPDRTYGVTVLDGYSAPLATAMRDAMRARFGKAPHLIICELSRTKVDCNREIVEGAQGNAKAEGVWHEYHALIDEAEKTVLGTSPHGMYFDIHSHGHPKKRVEIGYLLKKEDLALTDAQLNADAKVAGRSSIRELGKLTPAGFAELLRGPTSLGGLLEERGIPAIPSPKQTLEAKDPYFNGSFDITAHGTRDKAQLDGVQFETPGILRDTADRRAATAKVIAEVVDIFFERHFQLKLPHEKN